MKKCNQCGTILPDTAKFCRKCGADLSNQKNYTLVNEDGSELTPKKDNDTSERTHSVKRCRICGSIVTEGARFCRNCGADMTDSANYVIEGEESEKKPLTAENSENTKTETKKSIPQVRKCKNCGTIVPEGMRFCGMCGSDMSNPANYTLVNDPESEPAKVDEPEVKKTATEEVEATSETEKTPETSVESENPAEPVIAETQKSETPKIKKCNQCGMIVSNDAKFCRGCGADMSNPANYTLINDPEAEPAKADEPEVKKTATEEAEATSETEKTPETSVESENPAEPVIAETQKSETTKVKKCNQCGMIVSNDAKFCRGCGADMSNPANYTLVDDPNADTVQTEETAGEDTSNSEKTNVPEDLSEKTDADNNLEKGNIPEASAESEKSTEPEQTEEPVIEETKNREVQKVKKCNQCGTIVPDNAKFCRVCGADMRDPSNYTLVDDPEAEPAKADEPEVKKTSTEEAEVTLETEKAPETSVDHENPAEPVITETQKSETPKVKKCNQCGMIVSNEAKFCRGCGSDMSNPSNYTLVDDPNAAPVDGTASSSEDQAKETPAESSEKKPTESEETASIKEETKEPETDAPKVKKCNQCGMIVSNEAKFCRGCGSDMSNPSNYTLVDDPNAVPVEETASSSEDQTKETPVESGEKKPTESEETASAKEETKEPETDAPKVKKCNHCGTIVPDEAKFCRVCGADMNDSANYTLVDDPSVDSQIKESPAHKVKKCNHCGKIIPEGVKFCNGCGADMNDPANYTMVDEEKTASVRKVKKCNRCGQIILEDVKFCVNCGNDLSDPANYTMVDEPTKQAMPATGTAVTANSALQNEKVQKFLQNKKAVAGIIIAIVAVIALIIYLIVRPKTINLADYTTINVSGYDGHGVAEVTIDEDRLESDITNAAIKKHTYQYLNSTSFDPTYKLDQSENLSNGDTVTLKWNVSPDALKNLKIHLKTKDVKEKVSGLSKTETFDAFKGIKVQVSGAAPYGEAKLNKTEKDGLTYKLNKETGLSNGDKIKVTVSSEFSDDKNFTQYVDRYGKMPEKTSKTFEVADLDQYITSADDLTDDVIKKMRSQAEDVIKADDVNNLSDDVHLDSLTYQGLYFLKAKDRKDKDNDNYYDDAYNKVYIVELQTYSVKKYFSDEIVTVKAYTAVEFNSISKASDGTINVDLSDYSILDGSFEPDIDDVYDGVNGYKTQDDVYDECVTSQADEYSSETKAAS